MWSDKSLELLITPAIDLLEVSGFRHARVSIMTGIRPPHEDYRDYWAALTPGLRAYAYLFLACVSRRPNFDALFFLCQGDRKLQSRVWKSVKDAANQHNRDVVNIPLSKWLQTTQRQQDRRSSGWTREDVVAEFYDETGEPRLGAPKRPLEPRLAEYQPNPSPVRRVSPEEYLASRREPKYGGVKPEFEKDSEHFAKEKPENADKIYDGTPLDELLGQST